ncbi:MAG: serine hydrolase [Kiritimatiellae bacterium]|nr:serine hydrolase [Kiritimatiellia bacterium]
MRLQFFENCRGSVAIVALLLIGVSGVATAQSPNATAECKPIHRIIRQEQEWQPIAREETGIDPKAFDAIPDLITKRKMGTTGLMIIVHGGVAYQYGDVKEVSYIASCRKSILSLMYGNFVENGQIDLKKTVGDLKITDVGGLLPIETTATVLDLITARSGVYHPASNPGGIKEGMEPVRGKTKPGTKFLYNNWDFNVAGTVFELMTHQNIYDVFDACYAKPLMFQDWDRSRHKKSGDMQKSSHLAYHFYFSTRDMAKIGELMLRKGKWNGQQLVPEKWVEESTRPFTVFGKDAGGYGYMWWYEKFGRDLPGLEGSYTASGQYGQYITVLPKLDMVIAHKSARNAAHRTSKEHYSELLHLICSGARLYL